LTMLLNLVQRIKLAASQPNFLTSLSFKLNHVRVALM